MLIIKMTLMVFSLFFLCRCTSYQEHFECDPKKGVGCQSLSEVDQLVESGKLPLGDQPHLNTAESSQNSQKDTSCSCKRYYPKEKEPQEKMKEQETSDSQPISSISPVEIMLEETSSLKSSDSWEVKRKGEEVIRVWIPPYQDEEGNYHSSSYLYSVLTPGAWEKKE